MTIVPLLLLVQLLLLSRRALCDKCYELQSGPHVESGKDVALSACLPKKLEGGALNCDHCTHAGSFTSCYKLDSRCSPSGEKRPDSKVEYCFPRDEAKLENWGYGPVDLGQTLEIGQINVWMRNYDLKGQFKVVESVCIDHYCEPCFYPYEAGAGRASAALLLYVVAPVALILLLGLR